MLCTVPVLVLLLAFWAGVLRSTSCWRQHQSQRHLLHARFLAGGYGWQLCAASRARPSRTPLHCMLCLNPQASRYWGVEAACDCLMRGML